MATLIKTLRTFSNGSCSVENHVLNLPAGFVLAQIGEYQQAASGNPAVIPLRDHADTVYTKQWQLALYAHNLGMLKNNICHPFSYQSALANRTGWGNPSDPKRNYITGESLDKRDMWIDKLRTFSLNTHAVMDYDSKYYRVWTQDGSIDPLMKPGKTPPSCIADIDSGKVKSTDYVYNPQETLFAFLVCNNYKAHAGGQTSISPFPGGLKYPWTPDDENYVFVPLVSKIKEPVLSNKALWTKTTGYNSPYRRI